MRYGLLAVLMFLAAFLWGSCSSPYDVARREVARVTSATQTMEAGLKSTTKVVLDGVVAEEKGKREKALSTAGCPTTSRPSSDDPALAKCQTIWDDAEASYRARSREVAAKAAKVDAAIGATYQTLLLAVQIIAESEKGLTSKESVTSLVGRLLPMLDAVKKAYDEWKLFAATFTPLPGWLP